MLPPPGAASAFSRRSGLERGRQASTALPTPPDGSAPRGEIPSDASSMHQVTTGQAALEAATAFRAGQAAGHEADGGQRIMASLVVRWRS
ncbi:hypothetical protein ABZ914_03670 [Spirillospora sp. NPDC046719]